MTVTLPFFFSSAGGGTFDDSSAAPGRYQGVGVDGGQGGHGYQYRPLLRTADTRYDYFQGRLADEGRASVRSQYVTVAS